MSLPDQLSTDQSSASRLVVHPIRLTPGQELYSTLMKYARDRKLRAPFVMTCCGSVTKAKLRLAAYTANLDPGNMTENQIKSYQGPFEIVSLVGTLSGAEGHLHISLSDVNGHVIGGHVIGDLEIFTTAEVVLGECTDVEFTREFDSNTGFDELVVKRLS